MVQQFVIEHDPVSYMISHGNGDFSMAMLNYCRVFDFVSSIFGMESDVSGVGKCPN